MIDTYKVNEIFFSLQGEGVRAGTGNVFIRFTGCNLRCRKEEASDSPGGFDCDTEFVSGRTMTKEAIVSAAKKLGGGCGWVILTGGEPGLQVDAELIDALHTNGFKIAIETNGSVELPEGLDWITVSPKVAEHAIRQKTANEVKYVRGWGQGIPRPTVEAEHKLISPAFDGTELDPETLAWCIKLVKENAEWRLSVQNHKSWKVR